MEGRGPSLAGPQVAYLGGGVCGGDARLCAGS